MDEMSDMEYSFDLECIVNTFFQKLISGPSLGSAQAFFEKTVFTSVTGRQV